MHQVAVLALDGVVPFELGIPSRIFGAATDADDRPLYDVVTCAPGGGTVTTADDFTVTVPHGLEALRDADTVVVPPSHTRAAAAAAHELDERVVDALRALRPDTRVASICTASFVLAAAGLLDGRRATTHWLESAALQRAFPRVRVDADVLFVDEGRVLTSAGAAAGVDLCLHLVRRDHGAAVANQVARRCVVPPWRDGGQAQYVERPVPPPADTSTAASREWALAHLDRPLTLAELAARAGMSVRTFSRRFRAEVGLTPVQWLVQQRVDRARRMLEAGEESVDRVAARAGFATAASMRMHFRLVVGVTPASYRRTFQGALR
jgi:transcriptional regulator GlxA family with amidase domain